MAAIGTAITAPLVGAVKQAADFEYAMDAVNASLGGVDTKTMDLLSQQALELGANTKFSAVEVAQAQEILGKAGIEAQDLLDGATKSVLDLSAATGEELPLAAESASNAMNLFGLQGSDMAKVADVMTGALNESSASLPALNAGMTSLGSVLANQNRYLEMTEQGLNGNEQAFLDTAAAVSYFTKFGLKGADAGISLARGITNLSNPTSKATEKMNELGISAFDVNGNFLPLPDLFDQLNDAMSGMSDQAREQALATIFGAEAADVMNQAIKRGGDPLREHTKLLDEDGTAAKQAAIRQDNLTGAVEQLGGALNGLGIQMGKPLLDPIKNATKGVTGLVDALAGAPPEVQKFVAEFAALSGGLLVGGGGLAYGTGKVLELGQAFRKAGLSLPLFSAGLLGIGAALGLGLLAYESDFMGFGQYVDENMAKASKAVETFGRVFDEAFFENKNAEMGQLAAGIAAFGTAVDAALGTNLSQYTRKLAEGLDVLQDSFARGQALGIDPWVNALQSAAEAARAMGLEDIANGLYKGSQAWDAMRQSMEATEGQMPELNRWMSALGAGFDNLFGTDVTGFFDNFGAALNSGREGIGAFKDDLLAGDWDGAWDGLTGGMDALGIKIDDIDLGGKLQGVSDQFTDWFQGVGDLLMGKEALGPGDHSAVEGLLPKLAEDLTNGFTELPGMVSEKLADVDFSSKLGGIKDTFGGWFDDIGDALLGTTAQMSGSGDITGQVQKGLIPELADDIVTGFQELPQMVGDKLGEVDFSKNLGGVKDQFGDWMGEISKTLIGDGQDQQGMVQELATNVAGGFQQLPDLIGQKLGEVNFSDNLGAVKDQFGSWMGDIGDLLLAEGPSGSDMFNASAMKQGLIPQLADSIATGFEQLPDMLNEKMGGNPFDGVGTWLSEQAQQLPQSLGDLKTTMLSTGQDIGDDLYANLLDGIAGKQDTGPMYNPSAVNPREQAAKDSMGLMVGDFVDTAKEYAADVTQFSPETSRALGQAGVDIGEGMAGLVINGVQQGFANPASPVGRDSPMFNPSAIPVGEAKEQQDNWFTAGLNLGPNIGVGLRKGVDKWLDSGGRDDIQQHMENKVVPRMAEGIVEGFGNLGLKVREGLDATGGAFQAVGDWFDDGITELTDNLFGTQGSEMYNPSQLPKPSGFQQMLDGVAEGVADGFTQFPEMVASKLPTTNPFDGVGEWLDNSWSQMTDAFAGPSASDSAMYGSGSGMGSGEIPGGSMLQGFVDGMVSNLESLGAGVTGALEGINNPFEGAKEQMATWLGPLGDFLFPGASAAGLDGEDAGKNIFGDPAAMGAKFGEDIAETFASDEFITGIEAGMKALDAKSFDAVGGALLSQMTTGMTNALRQPVSKDQGGSGELGGQTYGEQMLESLAMGLTDTLAKPMPEMFAPVAGGLLNGITAGMELAMMSADESLQSSVPGSLPLRGGGAGDLMVQGLTAGLANSILGADPAMFVPVSSALGTQLGNAMMMTAQPTQAPGGVGPQGPAVPAMGETMVQGLATGLANGIAAADPAMFVPVSNALGTQLGAAMSMAAQQVQPPGGVGPVAPETGGMGTTMVQGLAQGLTDSITAAPVEMFHPVANALGTQLGAALNEAMTKTVGVGENTTGGMVGSEAAGGIGAQMVQNLSTGLSDSITNAPTEVFTPVGEALGLKMTEALQTAVEGGAQGGTGAEGATGVGQQMGDAVGQMLVSGVEQADWAPVGTSLSTKLGETLQTAATDNTDISKTLGDSVGQMLQTGVADADFSGVSDAMTSQLTDSVQTAVTDAATGIEEAMTGITDAVTQAVEGMAEAISGAVEDVSTAVEDMSTAVSEATSEVSTAVEEMSTAVSEASTTMSEAATEASTAAEEIGTAASEAATAVETAMQAMAAAVQAAAGAIAGAAGQIIGSLNAIAAAASAAAGAVGAVGGAGGGYTPAPATGGSGARMAEGQGLMVSEGMARGMEGGAPLVEQASQQVADAAYDSMAKAIQMGSPAKRFEPVGASISQGMMKGMLADAKSRLKSAMGKMAGQVQSAMGKIKSAMSSAIGQVQSRIKEGLARAQGQAAAGGQAAGKAAAEGSAAGVDSASDENSKAIKRMWKKAVKKLLEGKGEMRFLGEEFAREFWLGMLDTSGSLEFAQFVTDQAVAAAENAIEKIKAKIQGLATQVAIVNNTVQDLADELADVDAQLAAMDAAAAEEAAAAAAQARLDAAQALLDAQKAITAELEKQFSTEFQAAHQAHIAAAQNRGQGGTQQDYESKLAKAQQTKSLLDQSKAMEEHLANELEMIRKAIQEESQARAAAAKEAARAELEARRAMLAEELAAAKAQQAEILAAQHAAQVEYTNTVIAESNKRIDQLQKEKKRADSPEERANAQAEIALEQQKIELANQLAAALERQANAQNPEALAQANAQVEYYTQALAALDEVDIGAMLQELVDKMGEVATAIGSAATAMDSAATAMSSMQEPAAAAASSMGEVGKATGTLGQQIEAATGGMFSMGAKYHEVMAKMAEDGYAFQAQFQAMTEQVRGTAETAGTAIGTSLSTGITDRITQGGPALQQAMVDGLNGVVTQGTDIASRGGADIATAFGQEMHGALGTEFPKLQEQIRTGLQKPIDAGIDAAEKGGSDIGKGLMVEAKNGLDDKVVPWSNHAKKVIDDPIKDGIRAADKGGRDIGTAMGDGMLDGIRSRTAGIANEVRRTVSDAVQAGHDAARNGSPSREMMEVGDFMGQGLEVGLRAHRKSAAEESEALVHIPRLSPTNDGGVTGNRARNSANNGGNVIHIGNVTLPGVTNPQEFLDAISSMERRNGVSSGRL